MVINNGDNENASVSAVMSTAANENDALEVSLREVWFSAATTPGERERGRAAAAEQPVICQKGSNFRFLPASRSNIFSTGQLMTHNVIWLKRIIKYSLSRPFPFAWQQHKVTYCSVCLKIGDHISLLLRVYLIYITQNSPFPSHGSADVQRTL